MNAGSYRIVTTEHLLELSLACRTEADKRLAILTDDQVGATLAVLADIIEEIAHQ